MRKPHRPLIATTPKSLPLLLALPLLPVLLLLLPSLLRPNSPPSFPLPPLPKLAYFISSSRTETRSVNRLLKAVYHPRNFYLLYLDLLASPEERRDLKEFAESEFAFAKFGNVRVLESGEAVSVRGATMVSSVLHAAAVLLREVGDWTWFVYLDAADYPLVNQDDLLHILSFLPRDLNFVEHTSNIGWKEHQRARPIIVDPGLHGSDKTDVFWVKDRRSLPSSFKLFVGSSCVILSWSFLKFCILGWDNLPRTLLMYYTNFLASIEGYFHTVICNSMDFQNTTINHDLRFTVWDDQPRQTPMNLTFEHFSLMVASGAPFARTFVEDSPVLDRIDVELLKRSRQHFVPGGWCLGNSKDGIDPCSIFGEADMIRPTAAGSKRLEQFFLKLLDEENFRPRQCK